MPAVKHGRRTKRKRSAGQNRPGELSRFIAQGISSSEASPKKVRLQKPKLSDGDFVAAIGESVADAFFGASPVVASALGIRSGATPRGQIHSKPAPSALLRKPDVSILLGIGHFYFALTGGARHGSDGLRIFFFCGINPSVVIR